MKKIIMTAIAAASVCLLSACGGDDSKPSRADICAKGLNEDCLVGLWNLQSIQSKDGSQIFTDFGTTPSTLEFMDNGQFHFVFTNNGSVSEMASDGCGGTDNYGTWEITGSVLKLKIGRTDCLETGRSYTLTPTITERNLNLNTVVFHENDMTDNLTKSISSEYFVRVGE